MNAKELLSQVFPGTVRRGKLETKGWPKTPSQKFPIYDQEAVDLYDSRGFSDWLDQLRDCVEQAVGSTRDSDAKNKHAAPIDLTAIELPMHWPMAASRGRQAEPTVRNLFARRLAGEDVPEGTRVFSASFPVVRPNGISVVIHIHARVMGGAENLGMAWMSPGGHRSVSAYDFSLHSIFTRRFDAVFAKAFADAILAAQKDSGLENPPGLELWLSPDYNDSQDYAALLNGPSAGAAVYTVARAAFEERPLRKLICITGAIGSQGVHEGQKSAWTIEPVDGVYEKFLKSIATLDVFKGWLRICPQGAGGEIPDDLAAVGTTEELWAALFDDTNKISAFLEARRTQIRSSTDNLLGIPVEKFDSVRLYGREKRQGRFGVQEPKTEAGKTKENLAAPSGATPSSALGGSYHSEANEESGAEIVRLTMGLFRRSLSFLRGGAGLGKSFAMGRLYCDLARDWNEGMRLPLLVRVKWVAEQYRSTKDIGRAVASAAVKELSGNDGIQGVEAILASRVRSGQVHLLMDGLDECDKESRKEILAALQAIGADNAQTSPWILLAGRSYGMDDLMEGLAEGQRKLIDLEPLDRWGRRAVIAAAAKDETGLAANELASRPGLDQLMGTPFTLLATLVALKSNPELAQQKLVTPGMVLETALGRLVARARQELESPAHLRSIQWQHASYPALRAADAGAFRDFTVKQFFEWCKREAAWTGRESEALELLHAARMLCATDLDALDDPNTVLYAAHRMIWEFLAGRALAERIAEPSTQAEAIDYLVKKSWDPQFEEVAFFAVDHLANNINRHDCVDEVLDEVLGDGWLTDPDQIDKLDLLGIRETLAGKFFGPLTPPKKYLPLFDAHIGEMICGSRQKQEVSFRSTLGETEILGPMTLDLYNGLSLGPILNIPECIILGVHSSLKSSEWNDLLDEIYQFLKDDGATVHSRVFGVNSIFRAWGCLEAIDLNLRLHGVFEFLKDESVDVVVRSQVAKSLFQAWACLEKSDLNSRLQGVFEFLTDESVDVVVRSQVAETLFVVWRSLEPIELNLRLQGVFEFLTDESVDVVVRGGVAESISGALACLEKSDLYSRFQDVLRLLNDELVDSSVRCQLALCLVVAWSGLETSSLNVGLEEAFKIVKNKDLNLDVRGGIAESISGAWSNLEPSELNDRLEEAFQLVKDKGYEKLVRAYVAASLFWAWGSLDQSELNNRLEELFLLLKDVGTEEPLCSGITMSLSGAWSSLCAQSIEGFFNRLLELCESNIWYEGQVFSMVPGLSRDLRGKLDQWLRGTELEDCCRQDQWGALGRLYTAEWLDKGMGGLICPNLGSLLSDEYQSTINTQLLGPVRYVRGEIGLSLQTTEIYSNFYNAFAFWRPLYSEGFRLFERNPPGESKHGFLYVRTIEDLTRDAVLPPRPKPPVQAECGRD